YVGFGNEILSPLYTWCDKRSNEKINEKETYCENLNRIANSKVRVGYGYATHYYNLLNKKVPQKPYQIMTIHDYIVSKLTNNQEHYIHASNAASFGLFDLEKRHFDYCSLENLGIDIKIIPTVVSVKKKIGEYRGVPVYIAIGDNQASYLGASKGEIVILFNVGTGSQISVKVDYYVEIEDIETRPYLDDSYLLVGASISGGRAFEALAKFFQEISHQPLEEIYQEMTNYEFLKEDDLIFDTNFSGTRTDSNKKGALHNLTLDNFHKTNFVNAILKGTTNELYHYYQKMNINHHCLMVGSGNGIRKNILLQKIVTRTFNKELIISKIEEEAAYGAALFSSRKE
ncbi:MAG: FGGY family carbohydrate kinase, partial [Bacilli bacterium]|nr:FGGY family carbohydrate kinase [Bacilli bacterium]